MADAPSSWRFEPLARSHNTREFGCGEESLDRYIKQFALSNHTKGTARAYVGVRQGSFTVAAYYTLSPTEVSLDALAEAERKGLPRMVGGFLIGRMAVDAAYQQSATEKLGHHTLQNALARAVQAADLGGGYFVMVDPLTPRAREFYVRAGFVQAPGLVDRLLYPFSAVRKLGLPLPE